jgi:hypothetical protein
MNAISRIAPSPGRRPHAYVEDNHVRACAHRTTTTYSRSEAYALGLDLIAASLLLETPPRLPPKQIGL